MKKPTLLVISIIFLGISLPADAATKVVYESDFSSDPGWTTDQPENFYHDASAGALHVNAIIKPSGSPSRYFVKQTDLDPTKSFSLEFDFHLGDFDVYSMFYFGLYSDDLLNNRIAITANRKTPLSTLNFSHSKGDSSNYYSISIFTDEKIRSQGSGHDGPQWQPNLGDWYSVRLWYDAEKNKVFYTVHNRQTGKLVLERPDGYVLFGDFHPSMQYLGFSLYPQGEYGTNSYASDRLQGTGTFLIDNVRLTQEVEEEPPLSDLLLQYEPILQFHEDEDYFPMNVDAFVEGSGLWDSSFSDTVLIPRGENNELTLDYLATTTDSSNWYVAFSSEEAGTYDLAAAKDRYDSLITSGKAVPTYYAHQSEDSYVDAFGNRREYIVLQYWYFYAMNNWREQGGFNDHEGDWESVFVFLDKATQEPEYVAFSAHHNDGDPSLNILQYDSVRRTWSDTQRTGDSVNSYVAAGSHANYSFASNHNARSGTDEASGSGEIYKKDSWQKRKPLDVDWNTNFEGLFGTKKIGVGTEGSQGPYFTGVSGYTRFQKPVEWSGIDRIDKTVLVEPQQIFDLINQNVKFDFGTPLSAGTTLSSALYEEFVTFGVVDELNTLLPKYWEFFTSMPNASFRVDITLSYADAEMEALDLDERTLNAFYYDETENEWKLVESSVNTKTNEVSFSTDHFSLFTIGSTPLVTERNEENEQTSTSTESSTDDTTGAETADNSNKSPGGKSQSTRTNQSSRAGGQVLGISTINDDLRLTMLLQVLDLLIELKELLVTLRSV